MSKRHALLIGSSEFEDGRLSHLQTPGADVANLGALLRLSSVGAFDEVNTLNNPDTGAARRAIARLFSAKAPGDLLLLFFSGHGVRDENGDLYLAVRDTDHGLLSATAVPAAFVTAEMDRSRSRSQVLILDCCHSGAFSRGMKASVNAPVGCGPAFQGTGMGRVVLTASDSTQYAWEGDQVVGQNTNSVFSRFLIQGLQTGEADIDTDGKITVDELYNYVFEKVANATPLQTPGKWTYKQQGEIVLAHNPSPAPKRARLPLELEQAIESPLSSVRNAAVGDLLVYLRGPHQGRALAAKQALERLRDDDSRQVAFAAAAALAAAETTTAYQQPTAATPPTKTPPAVTNPATTSKFQAPPGARDPLPTADKVESASNATAPTTQTPSDEPPASPRPRSRQIAILSGAILAIAIVIAAINSSKKSSGPPAASRPPVEVQAIRTAALNPPPGRMESTRRTSTEDAARYFEIGERNDTGQGVAKNHVEALKWYHKAAALGNADAMLRIGEKYFKGEGVSKDLVESAKWFQKAADLNQPIAMGYLGVMIELTTKDYARAVEHYRKAADLGNGDATFKLGELFEYGRGVVENKAEAAKWYRKAAELGNSDAMNRLGETYEKAGKNDEAINWYRMADNKGNAAARSNLTRLGTSGRGKANQP